MGSFLTNGCLKVLAVARIPICQAPYLLIPFLDLYIFKADLLFLVPFAFLMMGVLLCFLLHLILPVSFP